MRYVSSNLDYMKNIPTDLIKNFYRDRTMLGLSVGLLLVVVGYTIYIALALEPSDLQVAVRYTAFGDVHFYRDKWYYLLSFILFGIVLAGVYIALAVKLHGRNQRQFAIFLMALGLLMMVISWIITRSVLQIAFL